MNSSPSRLDHLRLAQGIRSGQRRALARGITLVESERPDHRQAATLLLDLLLAETGKAFRLGVAGPPGAGKSTFIGALGCAAVDQGHRVAVLAIDPSSPRSGGSILGDKTRMDQLSRDDRAYIRPSPTSGALGGTTWRTREAILLCEAAGFDLVIVETVGVGQSETAIADMVDVVLLLLAPGGGDDLQGIKKGIVEVADLVVVNKADGDWESQAERTVSDYRSALSLLRPPDARWPVEVLAASAFTGKNILSILGGLVERQRAMAAMGALDERRRRQGLAWLEAEIRQGLLGAFRAHPQVAALLTGLEGDILAGRASPPIAAKKLVQAFLDSGSTNA